MPQMCLYFLKLKVGVRVLTQKRTASLGQYEGEEVLLFCIVEWRLLFAIFQF